VDAIQSGGRDARYRQKISELKSDGGQKGSLGLRELIVKKEDVSPGVVVEAAEALASLGRPEDVPFLFDWATRSGITKEAQEYGPPVYAFISIVGKAGGRKACSLLVDYLDAGLLATSYEMDLGKMASIVLGAQCLSEEEVRKRSAPQFTFR